MLGANSANIMTRMAVASTIENPITAIYTPQLQSIQYTNTSTIKEYGVGDTIALQVDATMTYVQVERFDNQTNTFIGADEKAETKSCNIVPNIEVQWYRDGRATDIHYTVKANDIGKYVYSVSVNGEMLEELMIEVVSKATTEEPKKEEDLSIVEGNHKESITTKDVNLEKINTGSTNTTSVATGDEAPIGMFIIVGILAMVCGMYVKFKED